MGIKMEDIERMVRKATWREGDRVIKPLRCVKEEEGKAIPPCPVAFAH